MREKWNYLNEIDGFVHRTQIILVAVICLVTFVGRGYAQQHGIRPYFGAGGTLGSSGPGWCVEAGMLYVNFYLGVEYGGSYPWRRSVNYDPGRFPAPYAAASENFLGIHAGYSPNAILFFGIVLLRSSQLWNNWDTVSSGWIASTRKYLDGGADFRYAGLAAGHMYLAFALTMRRGFKFGLGYIF